MDNIAQLPIAERSALFRETADSKGTTPAVIEKDFWVTWVLGRLFDHSELGRILMFKGGTSLSKVYGLIERFSENIDLILDWRQLGEEDPLASRSNTKQEKLNKEISAKAQQFIGGELLLQVSQAIKGICSCEVELEDAHVINVRYPAAFPDTYLRPELRLEVGPLAAWLPHEDRKIKSYAADVFPDVFSQAECTVKVIRAERTFWEKATILHHEAHRPAGSVQPLRYSRHYYDLAKMAAAPVKDAALADPGLLSQVVEFKQRFYPRGWAHYDLAKPGTMRLIPGGEVMRTVEKDYQAMAKMVFGELPDFEEMMATLRRLEAEINSVGR